MSGFNLLLSTEVCCLFVFDVWVSVVAVLRFQLSVVLQRKCGVDLTKRLDRYMQAVATD